MEYFDFQDDYNSLATFADYLGVKLTKVELSNIDSNQTTIEWESSYILPSQENEHLNRSGRELLEWLEDRLPAMWQIDTFCLTLWAADGFLLKPFVEWSMCPDDETFEDLFEKAIWNFIDCIVQVEEDLEEEEEF